MIEKKYYSIEETLVLLSNTGLTINIIGSYVREKLIHPIIYINSLPAHACEDSNEGKDNNYAMAVGHCFISAYWDAGAEIVGIMDNLISSNEKTIEIHPLIKKEFLIEEPEIFAWQYNDYVFKHVPPEYVNPKPFTNDLKLRYFMLTSPDKKTATLKLINILLTKKDFELLKQHMDNEPLNNLVPPKDKRTRTPKNKSNPLQQLIAEQHSQSKEKTPKEIWCALENLCNADLHPILQEVNSWDQDKTKIYWKSHRGRERSLGRKRFENIISELNNPI